MAGGIAGGAAGAGCEGGGRGGGGAEGGTPPLLRNCAEGCVGLPSGGGGGGGGGGAVALALSLGVEDTTTDVCPIALPPAAPLLPPGPA